VTTRTYASANDQWKIGSPCLPTGQMVKTKRRQFNSVQLRCTVRAFSNGSWFHVYMYLIPGVTKNVLNICMHYSPEQSKWISAKAYM